MDLPRDTCKYVPRDPPTFDARNIITYGITCLLWVNARASVVKGFETVAVVVAQSVESMLSGPVLIVWPDVTNYRKK